MALTDLPKTTGGLYIPPKGYPDWHEPINENFISLETQINNKDDSLKNATAKTTPVDADAFPLIDSAASNAIKKVTFANLKSALLKLTGYTKATSSAAIAATDSVSIAIGKLEKKADDITTDLDNKVNKRHLKSALKKLSNVL